MDLFVEHIDEIRPIAEKLEVSYHERFQSDELINAAYMDFLKAIENPEFVAKIKDNQSVLFIRAKMDMMHYVRNELRTRHKNQIKFVSLSMEDKFDEEQHFDIKKIDFHVGFEEVDNRDFIDAMFDKVTLSEEDWSLIQEYFYDERTLKEIGKDVGKAESTMHKRKANIIDNLRESIEMLV